MLQNTFLLIVYFFLFTEQNNLNMYLTRLFSVQLINFLYICIVSRKPDKLHRSAVLNILSFVGFYLNSLKPRIHLLDLALLNLSTSFLILKIHTKVVQKVANVLSHDEKLQHPIITQPRLKHPIMRISNM